ncbi:glycosyltransferase [bacterium]|nr:glycosyltransferase [bacterium]
MIHEDSISDAERFWDEKGINQYSDELRVCFFGFLGRIFPIKSVVQAAQILQKNEVPVAFVICGPGDMLERYRSDADRISNMIFPGWVNAAQIAVLMQRSTVGLDPLPESYDFLSTINNKAIEYMSAGLPVISSPREGVLYRFLKDHACGVSYNSHNPEELAQILTELSHDPVRIETMSENSRRIFQEKFTAEKVYNNMADYLEEIAQKPFNLNSGNDFLNADNKVLYKLEENN